MKMSRFRNLFRFRLRTLLIAFTVVAVLLGLHVRSAERQRHAVLAIRQYGGWVRYEFQFPKGHYSENGFDPKARSIVPQWLLDQLGMDFFHNVVQVSLNYSEDSGKREENKNFTDEAMQYLVAFPNLRVLLLEGGQGSDEGMQYLEGLTKLEQLFMWDVGQVTDAGAAHLERLKNLRYIHLTTSQITDKSLAIFAQLPKIQGLSLQFNNFSDKGMESVAPLEQLTDLWVCGRHDRKNEITDAGLKQLENLKHLKRLGIQNTYVTPEAIQSFKKAVPGCKVSQ